MTTEMVLLSSVALWKMGVEYFSIIAVGAEEEEEEFILCVVVVWRRFFYNNNNNNDKNQTFSKNRPVEKSVL
jgi:hypothetical protein